MIATTHSPIRFLRVLAGCLFFGAPVMLLPPTVSGTEVLAVVSSDGESESKIEESGGSESPRPHPVSVSRLSADSLPIPIPVTRDDFAELREHSPFLRNLDISSSLILTGVARIEEETIATLYDIESRQSYVVSGEASAEGWQLVEVQGDQSDLETLTARIKVGGSEVVSIRYEKAPKVTAGSRSVQISTQIGDGSHGGGTGPHGGPDPRVLTPDQLADARNAARNVREGFQADGYADNATIPREVVEKISKLSVDQREGINVKMFEYRNRGLDMPVRQKIYNGLLDKAVKAR